MYKSIAVGFAFFTIATVLGALWAAEAWGGYCIAQRCEGISPYMLNSFLMVIPATILSTAMMMR